MINAGRTRVHVKLCDGQEFILSVVYDMLTPTFISRCIWIRDLNDKRTLKNTTTSRMLVPLGVKELDIWEADRFIRDVVRAAFPPR